MRSTFGKNLKVEIFGGSHEDCIGVTIRGIKKEIMDEVDPVLLQTFLDRRAPGSSPYGTPRKEPDRVRCTCTDPYTYVIENTDVRRKDYSRFRDVPRPGHADFTAREKYKGSLDMSGGGPFSGRMTAPLCIVGGIAKQILSKVDIETGAHLLSVGDAKDPAFDPVDISPEDLRELQYRDFPVFIEDSGEMMKAEIERAASEGDSMGASVEAAAVGLPIGLGGPMYQGAEGHVARILFGIPAVKAVEFGAGTGFASMRGSQSNDPFTVDISPSGEKRIVTSTNNCGGILGGITDGMPLIVRVTFKPTPSIALPQTSVNMSTMQEEELVIGGRHDPCVAVRAVPAVEAALAVAILDLMLEDEDSSDI